MRVVKLLLLFAVGTAVLASDVCCADDYVRLGVDGMEPDQDEAEIPFYILRECPDPAMIEGIVNGFVMTATGSATWSFVRFETDPVVDSWFDLQGLSFLNCIDGISPDSFLVGGVELWSGGMPVFTEERPFFSIIISVGSGEGEICLDSAFVPPAGTWQWVDLTCGAAGEAEKPSFRDAENESGSPFCIAVEKLPYVCGDADGSCGVDIDDAVFVINYIFINGPKPYPYGSGDASGSGEVDIDDVVYLITFIFLAGPEPICSYGTVTDFDGNVYVTKWIGDQCWMMKNLKVTHYRNGDPIPHVTDGSTWAGIYTGAYCNYINNEDNVAIYGRLYNWYAVDDSRNIAPAGWHVPSDEEWKQLEMYLGMSWAEASATGLRGSDEGGKLKEAGTAHWLDPNTGATNETGFAALPGGYRVGGGSFYDVFHHAIFWSSSGAAEQYAWSRGLDYNYSQVRRDWAPHRYGASVRCVKD